MPELPSSATIPIPKLSWGKRKQRSQMYRIATLDGRVVLRELEVSVGCANEPKSQKAFLVDTENQYLDERGMWVQVVGESNAVPMMSRVERDMEEQESLINKIYHDTKEDAKLAQFERVKKNAQLEALKWIVGLPTCAFVLIYGLSMLGN